MKKKKCLDKRYDIFLYVFITIILFIIFFNYYRYHFVSDAYRIIYNSNSDWIIKLKLVEGRPIQSLYFFVISRLNIHMNSLGAYLNVYRINLTISILLISFICFYLYIKLKRIFNLKLKKHKVFFFLVSLLITVNISTCEYLLFIENYIMILGFLITLIAGDVFNSKVKCKEIISFLLLLLASFCYQGTITVFLVYVFILKLIDNLLKKESNKNIFFYILKAILIYFIVIGINYIFIQISNNYFPGLDNRVSSQVDITTDAFYVAYFFIYYLDVLIPVFILFLFINKIQKRELSCNFNILMLLILTSLSISVFCFGNTAVFTVPRLTLAMYVILAIVCLYIFTIDYVRKKFNINFILIFMTIIFILQVATMIYFQLQNVYSTQINQKIINEIISKIEKYERENDIEITNIAFYDDMHLNYKYFNVTSSIYAMYTYPIYYESWSDIYSINVLSGRNFKRVSDENLDKELYYYFKSNDLDTPNLDMQIIFKENTVHICRF